MMLSTLSCSVFGPGPLPPLTNTVAYGPELPAHFTPPSTTIALHNTAQGNVDLSRAMADLATERDPSIVRAAFHMEPPQPRWTSPSTPQLETARAERPIEEAVLAHLMRYRRRTGLTDGEIRKLANRVVVEARRHAFDPGLVLAVMHVESRYDTFAVSNRDAMGLMQILPSTGEWMADKMGIAWQGPQTLFDPMVNVQIGVAYLRELADRYGSIHTALSAYNWGPGAIDRRIQRGAPLPKIYAQLVLDALGRTPRS